MTTTMKSKLIFPLILSIFIMNVNAQNHTIMKEIKKQTAGRDQLGDFAPKFAELNDDVLFGQVWSRQAELSPKLRSLITVTALVSAGITDTSLKYHLETAKKNGITRAEMAEALTHIAFYAGWPKGWGAFRLAKEVYVENNCDPVNAKAGIFGLGEPNEKYKDYFIGKCYLKSMVSPDKTNTLNVSNVTFEPACRNNWHRHTTEQILMVTAGEGWYQEWGKPAQFLQEGDVVTIPIGVKHWHGATTDEWFSHLSIMDTAKDKTQWLEPVNDSDYRNLSK